MTKFRVSAGADEDLIEIYAKGCELFGAIQAAEYQFELDDCFSLLAGNPRMGRTAESIGSGVRRHEHGSHVVLYCEEAGGILIPAVVHALSVQGLELWRPSVARCCGGRLQKGRARLFARARPSRRHDRM